MALHEMAEHTLTELDSLVDWQIVAHMVDTYGYWGKAGKPLSVGGDLPTAQAAVPTSPVGKAGEGVQLAS